MTIFKQLIEAAQFQITGGSEYQWLSYGPHARWLDFNSNVFDIDFSLVFDGENQTVYQASLYLDGMAFRWINPDFLTQVRQESFDKGIDPRVAYDDTFYSDCEVFEDFVNKVQEAFTSGICNTDLLIPLDLTPEQEEIFNQLPEGTNLQNFILEALEEKMATFSKQNSDNWDIVFSTLTQSGITTSIDVDNAPISQGNIQEIYNWINGLNLKIVDLFYSDKEVAEGIISTLTIYQEGTPNLTFRYTYKN